MKTILFSFLLAISLSVGAQELLIPSALMNRNSELSYSFTVVSTQDQELGTELAKEMSRLLTHKKLDIEYAPQQDTALVDVVFHLDRQWLSYRSHRIAIKNVSKAALKGAKLLEKLFYSGMRPTYSTVFTAEEGGYAEYRIPSVLSLPSGRIIALIEARNWHNDQAENDIIARYSDDMGRTWSRPIVVDEQGKSSLNNACAVYIAERNQVMVMYQSFPPKATEGGGLSKENPLRVYTVTSADGGETWSVPKEVSDQVKHPDATIVCSGPGVAIRATDGPDKGRIIVPFNGSGSIGWFNYVAYSDDLGDSWKYTKGHSGYGANESQVVQTGPTEYLINARSHRYPECNTSQTPDGWNPWAFARVTRNRVNTRLTLSGDTESWGETEVQANQLDPTCQGSVMRISGLGIGEKGSQSRILLANPASQHTVINQKPYANTPPQRLNGTVKLSYDEGRSWAHEKRIYGNRFTEYQYSVLVNLGDGKVGCLFEAYPDVKFAVFDLEWLTGGEDK